MASYATSLRSAAMSSSTSTDSKTFTDNIPVSILLSASKEFQSPLTQARYRVLFGEESPRCTDDDNPYVSPKGPPPDFKPPTISLDDLIFNFTDTLSFLQDVYRHTSLQVTLSATRQLMEHFVLPLGRHFWRLCAFAVTPDQEETLSTSPYADVTKTPREGVISVDREEPDSLFTSPSTHLHQAPLSKLSSILKDGKDPASHASTKRIKFGYTSTPLNIVDYIKTPSDTISPSSTKPFETQCFVDWITAGMKDWSEPPVVLGIPTSLCLFYFTCLITNSLPIVFPFAVSACLYFGEKPFTSIVLNNPRSVLQPFTLLVTQPDAIDFLCPSIIQYNSLYLFSIHVADGKRALLDRNRDARSSRLKVTQRRRAEQESLHKGFLSGKDNVSMKEDNMKETNHIKIRQMAQFVSPLSHQLLQLEESCGNVFDVPSPLFGLFGLDIPTTLGMHKKIIDAERAAEMDGIKPIEDEPVDCDIITNLTMLSEEDSNRVMMLEEADWKKKWEKQLQTQMKKKQAHLTKSTKHQRPIDKSTSFVQIMSHFRINEMSKQSPKVELLLQPLKNDRTHLLHAILDSPLFASLRQQKTDPAFTFSLDNLSYSSLILAAVFFFTNEIYTTTSDKIFTLLSIYLAKG
ncbi:hypothetical protein BLNAU_484 [Blattamonas nauphoetae]|uniref:UDENN domain-containing protein n=1 Tax=Blattamonas nauphoetae TaxID=2049346 RepID=A0ABQ9YLE6_9EUKA|nr:hypothetical protein BLNAU_484 [Blattamonas nauphoetae]